MRRVSPAETRNVHASENPDHLPYLELNRERGRFPGALRIRVRFNRHAMPWFDYLMVSPDEMRDVVEPTLWHVAEIIEPNELDTSDQLRYSAKRRVLSGMPSSRRQMVEEEI